MHACINLKCIWDFICFLNNFNAGRYEENSAYSSVAHMNYVVLGLFVFNTAGFLGAMFLMLSHGLVSSALFMLVGFCMSVIKLGFYYILEVLQE